MLLRELYAKCFGWLKVRLILSDNDTVVYEGVFDEFPFIYANMVVDTIGVLDDKLVVLIYG